MTEDVKPKWENLDSNGILAAYLDASGRLNGAQIAEKVGRTREWFYLLKKNPTFQSIRREALRQLTEKALQGAVDIESAFDGEILKSLGTLIQARDDDSEAWNVRIRAAEGILDRAPSAPRAKKDGEGSPQVVINIPIKQMENIERTLGEVGQGGIIELLKAPEEREKVAEWARKEEEETGEDFVGYKVFD